MKKYESKQTKNPPSNFKTNSHFYHYYDIIAPCEHIQEIG
jgi:hypothetical protein